MAKERVFEEDKVYLILNGADINCSNSAPIYVKNAKKAIISFISCLLKNLN